ncbi:TylF/MycF/NovP-related O-methyltransferase [Phenylobacterium sp.]|uniref:TylF/MycF/NovP-related O-methyltransferase n=1 Tax=Phenylobacterium sp. TaxID=1871053 RepID=UPI002FE2244D
MVDINLKNVTVGQGLALADGLMQTQHLNAALLLYRKILPEARGAQRRAILNRISLASQPTPRTAAAFAMLQQLERSTRDVFLGDGIATWLKTTPFLDDERFMALADQHSGLIPIAGLHWNLATVLWAVKRAERLDGDLMELGVFRGHTTLFTADYVGFADWPRKWFLYDTFEGVPDDQLDEGWGDRNERAYKNTFSYEEVAERFRPFPNIVITRGRVPEILDEVCPERIAFLHMDLNNSQAEIAALERLYDRIVPGGVIVFDDYGWAAARTQYEAERAWFAERGLEILLLPTGQGLFVKPER